MVLEVHAALEHLAEKVDRRLEGDLHNRTQALVDVGGGETALVVVHILVVVLHSVHEVGAGCYFFVVPVVVDGETLGLVEVLEACPELVMDGGVGVMNG